jgi:cell division protein ZapA
MAHTNMALQDLNNMSDSRTQGQPVMVKIYGQEYPIRGRGDEEHIKRVAQYVDERMAQIEEQSSVTTPARLAILAALNIADELFTLRREKERIVNEFEEKTRELSEVLSQGINEA